MAIGDRIGAQVDARLDHRLAAPLSVQPALDRAQDQLIGRREPGDIGTVQVGQLDPLHVHP